MIEITAIHLVGGQGHQHIADVRWRNPETGKTGESSRQGVVDWLLQDKANQACVSDGSNWIGVRVVNADPPYIQTWADGIWTDNLLALPRY